MTFEELPIGAHFYDGDGDLCRKVDPTNAKTPYCAAGFVAGFSPKERVELAVRKGVSSNAEEPQVRIT